MAMALMPGELAVVKAMFGLVIRDAKGNQTPYGGAVIPKGSVVLVLEERYRCNGLGDSFLQTVMTSDGSVVWVIAHCLLELHAAMELRDAPRK